MKVKHTQGKWFKTPTGKQGWLILHDNKPLAQVNGNQAFEEIAANAKLIAAAPELLETLSEIIELKDSAANTQELFPVLKAIDRAKLIIKKATS